MAEEDPPKNNLQAEEPKELSKGQQKKLAKKAEKAAKKAAKSDPTATTHPSTSMNTNTNTNTSSSPSPSNSSTPASGTTDTTWTLINPKADPIATVQVVWAAQLLCGISLESQTSTSSSLSLRLPCGTEVTGSAMLAACAAAAQYNNYLDQCWIDEWLEWDRCQCHNASKPLSKEALMHLEQALSSGGSLYLVGSCVSVADACIVPRLLMDQDEDRLRSLPPTVKRYVSTHAASHAKAVLSSQAIRPKTVTNSGSSSAIDMTNPSVLQTVAGIFNSIAKDVFPGVTLPSSQTTKLCANPKHGDYQCSAAMPIFAALRKITTTGNNTAKYASSQAIGAAIVQAIGTDHDVLENLQTQGPGFVLCRVRASYLQKHVNTFLQTQQLPMPKLKSSPSSHKGSKKKQTCVVDFSSPNIAKEMHVGHLRSTILGEAVCRILEANPDYYGTVHRVNHVGDWGTQFGMLIQYLKEEYPDVVYNSNGEDGSSGTTAELPNITDLTVFYKNAKERFDADPEFKKTAQTNVVKLQSGDSECVKIWQMLCDVSRKEFQKVYDRLDIKCEEFGESFYNAKIPPVIQEFEAAQQIKVEEGGAKCVFLDGFRIPLMLQKSDGGFGYDSTDMAALKYRLKDLAADRVIVITDFSQGDHFKMVYAAGSQIGWVDQNQRLEHIGFGTVQGEDGKRFKTRSGDTVRLVDLLDEAVLRMEAELKKRIDEGKANIKPEEMHSVAEAIGYGAVKYFDLRRNPTSNYKFSYDAMLDTKGDTAVYLLYARVRLESIVAKATTEHGVHVETLLKTGTTVDIDHPSERNLALQLQQFVDVMELTLEDLFPYHICEYVYKVATAASDFVTQCRVLGSPEMESRVLLCHATTIAMRQCFELLGIRHVKRI